MADDLIVTVKTLTKLLINGFAKVRELPDVLQFLQSSLNVYFLSSVKISFSEESTRKLPECFLKLFYEFVYNDPMSFAPLAGEILRKLVQVLFVETSNIVFMCDKFKLKAFNLMKIILLCDVCKLFVLSINL